MCFATTVNHLLCTMHFWSLPLICCVMRYIHAITSVLLQHFHVWTDHKRLDTFYHFCSVHCGRKSSPYLREKIAPVKGQTRSLSAPVANSFSLIHQHSYIPSPNLTIPYCHISYFEILQYHATQPPNYSESPILMIIFNIHVIIKKKKMDASTWFKGSQSNCCMPRT